MNESRGQTLVAIGNILVNVSFINNFRYNMIFQFILETFLLILGGGLITKHY